MTTLYRPRHPLGGSMTEHIDRDALRKLADAATDGPWEFPSEILGLPNPSIFAGDPKRSQVAHVALSGGADAEFIAAARTAVPRLLDQLDREEARVKAVRALHTGTRWPGVTDKPICDECDRAWPCPTIRALDA